jgi:hypothetical protein
MVGNGAIPVKFGEAAVTQEEIHLGIVGANAKKLLGKRLKPSVQIADARLNLATGVPFGEYLTSGSLPTFPTRMTSFTLFGIFFDPQIVLFRTRCKWMEACKG